VSAPLALEDISAAYGERMALESVTAAFDSGRITGLVGANGAGKTTILRAALGLVPVTGGRVCVLDSPRAQLSREALARTLAYLPQASVAHWPVEARRLVALGRLPYLQSIGRIGQGDLEAIDLALARCDALQFSTRRIDQLSAGERARVLLARALATGAKVLLADEPAAHLDPAHQLQLMELLRDEARRGTAVVVTLHDLPLAARFCDELLIVNKGRILARGAPQAVLSDDNLAAAFGVRPLRPSDGEPFPIIPWERIQPR
jgi:iron complex transport system ATP-binding protein